MDKINVKPSESSKGNILSIIVSVAAVIIAGVAAYAAISTQTQMKKEFETATQPQIIINDSRIGINMDPPQNIHDFRQLVTYTHNGKPDLNLII